MAELADAQDLKSCDLTVVWVQVPPRVLRFHLSWTRSCVLIDADWIVLVIESAWPFPKGWRINDDNQPPEGQFLLYQTDDC